MYNLTTLKTKNVILNNEKDEKISVSDVSFNLNSQSTFICCITEASESILIQEITNEGDISYVYNEKVFCDLFKVLKTEILDFQFLSETKTCCLIIKNGDIVLIYSDSCLSKEHIEIVGSVDSGIVAAKWAPDETILAICTGDSKFLLLSQNFEIISEIPLLESDINVCNHVSIGWGKSETQFQGKKSKTVPRDPTIPEKVDKGLLSPFDDQLTRLSWRDDGAFVSLSRIDVETRRIIRVFARNGVLESVSQPVDYLESFLAWKPSGSVIASVQRKPEELSVVFFEKNGLRHGEFNLNPFLSNEESILDIQWNCDSSLLSILTSNKIQFWYMSNYHWNLKYEIKFKSSKSVSLKWHPEIPLMLSLINDGNLVLYYFAWIIVSPPLNLVYDYGTVAVIDGDNLRLTPFKIANVPPPLSFCDVKLSEVPTSVFISKDSNFIFSLAGNMVEIIQWSLNIDLNALPKVIHKLKYDLTEFFDNTYYPRQILYLEEKIFCILLDTYNISEISFFLFDSFENVKLLNNISFKQKIALIDSGFYEKSIIVETVKGEIFDLSLEKDYEINNISLFSLPSLSYSIKSALYLEKKIVFSLTDNGRLFANDRLISTDCTSFICSKEYLIFTTTLHLVKFVKLMSKIEDLIIPSNDITNICVRSIEKGAKIISVVPSITALIFQMPRGNIETIYPRILVLSEIHKLIEMKKYDDAFLLCRTHRIDTNILYDYNPLQFLENVSLFIFQLNNSDYLNLFLSTLKEDDVTKTLYNLNPEIEKCVESDNRVLNTDSLKINTICDHVLKVLETYSDGKYIESILTAYLSKIPVDYDSALKLIIDLKSKKSDNAQKAIKYICIFADINMLYNYALGLYDLQLALLIAQNSQKDPKEYLPFLQDLQKQSISRRCFIIDDYLKRHEKALIHLIKIGNDIFDEISDYVVLHNLYREAMREFKNDLVSYNKILELYAIYHEKNNNFEESALAYEILNNYEHAIIMYKKSGLWRKALALAMKSKISSDDMNELAKSLSSMMQDKKKFCDAADIEIYYLKNLKEGLRLLCKSFDYNKAYELAEYYNSNELVQDIIIPGLMDGFSELTELFSELSSQLKIQVERVRILRKKKEQDPQAYFEPKDNEDIPDDISLADTDTSRSASIFTQYSTYTSTINTYQKNEKNSRRKERKRAYKQKGSVWEEKYLLNSIIRLIDRLEDAKEDAEKTIQGLLLEGLNEKANLLQKQIICLVNDVKECFKEMFSCIIENLPEDMQNNARIFPVVRSVNELKILV